MLDLRNLDFVVETNSGKVSFPMPTVEQFENIRRIANAHDEVLANETNAIAVLVETKNALQAIVASSESWESRAQLLDPLEKKIDAVAAREQTTDGGDPLKEIRQQSYALLKDLAGDQPGFAGIPEIRAHSVLFAYSKHANGPLLGFSQPSSGTLKTTEEARTREAEQKATEPTF